MTEEILHFDGDQSNSGKPVARREKVADVDSAGGLKADLTKFALPKSRQRGGYKYYVKLRTATQQCCR